VAGKGVELFAKLEHKSIVWQTIRWARFTWLLQSRKNLNANSAKEAKDREKIKKFEFFAFREAGAFALSLATKLIDRQAFLQ